MLKDFHGYEVTTNSLNAIAFIDDFTQQSLSYGNNAEGSEVQSLPIQNALILMLMRQPIICL
jgi:hypothetical protein